MKAQLAAFYREYLNDFLTVERFASYYDITVQQAQYLIFVGKQFHNEGY